MESHFQSRSLHQPREDHGLLARDEFDSSHGVWRCMMTGLIGKGVGNGGSYGVLRVFPGDMLGKKPRLGAHPRFFRVLLALATSSGTCMLENLDCVEAGNHGSALILTKEPVRTAESLEHPLPSIRYASAQSGFLAEIHDSRHLKKRPGPSWGIGKCCGNRPHGSCRTNQGVPGTESPHRSSCCGNFQE